MYSNVLVIETPGSLLFLQRNFNLLWKTGFRILAVGFLILFCGSYF